jgi:hypothetical protein
MGILIELIGAGVLTYAIAACLVGLAGAMCGDEHPIVMGLAWPLTVWAWLHEEWQG